MDLRGLDELIEEEVKEQDVAQVIIFNSEGNVIRVIKLLENYKKQEVDWTPTIDDTAFKLIEKINRRENWEEKNRGKRKERDNQGTS